MQEEARADRIAAIRDRTTDETRNLLIRFGRASALGGAGTAPAGDTSGTGQRDTFLNFMRQNGPLAFGKYQMLKTMGKL